MTSDTASEAPLPLTCHGGVGEIGGNKFVLETCNSSLLLDFGMSFGAEGQFFEEYLQPRSNSKLLDLLELELVPAIDGIYRYDALRPDGLQDLQDHPTRPMWGMDIQSYEEADNKGDWTPDGIFISHAHMDHVAYLPYLGDVPIVMSPTTETLVSAIGDVGNFAGFDDEFLHIERRQLDQSGSRAYFPGAHKIDRDDPVDRTTHPTHHGERTSIGPDFELEPIDVGHSIPGSQAALIETADHKSSIPETSGSMAAPVTISARNFAASVRMSRFVKGPESTKPSRTTNIRSNGWSRFSNHTVSKWSGRHPRLDPSPGCR